MICLYLNHTVKISIYQDNAVANSTLTNTYYEGWKISLFHLTFIAENWKEVPEIFAFNTIYLILLPFIEE